MDPLCGNDTDINGGWVLSHAFFLWIIHHPNYYMRNAGLYFQTFKGRDGWAWMGSGGEFSVYVCVCVVGGGAGWMAE